MTATKMQILTDSEVSKMLKRLAYQVYERNFDEKELVIAGICGQGNAVAKLLCEELGEISPIKIQFIEVQLDKENPTKNKVAINPSIKLENKCVIVVDDVLNTAKTFAYALLPFMGLKIKKLQTLVLVDRNHRLFPISADFIGMSLSTTLQEHVTVSIEKKKVKVFLS